MLPQHRLYDCAIDIHEDTQPPFESIYKLLKTNLLPFKTTLMKILPRISFDILNLQQAHLSSL
jgi:hypothetical protein